MTAAPVCDPLPTPFPSATGRGIRVAVIDSGVNASHPHICAPAQTIALGGSSAGSLHDTLGHGTAVTAAIQEKAPAAEYFAVKLFGSSLRATAQRLAEAIEWSIDNRMDVVNLSLGLANLDQWGRFQALVKRAVAKGIVLVSARSAGIRPLLPGALPEVIGVDVDWELPRDRYRAAKADGRWYFFASGYPRPLAGIPQSRNLSGISFAVANMTGFAVRACEATGDRSFETVREALAVEIHKEQNQQDIGLAAARAANTWTAGSHDRSRAIFQRNALRGANDLSS